MCVKDDANVGGGAPYTCSQAIPWYGMAFCPSGSCGSSEANCVGGSYTGLKLCFTGTSTCTGRNEVDCGFYATYNCITMGDGSCRIDESTYKVTTDPCSAEECYN